MLLSAARNIIFSKEGLPGVDYDIPAAPHDVVDGEKRRL